MKVNLPAAVVATVCGYELAALTTKFGMPTITSLVHQGRRHNHDWVRTITTLSAATAVGWLAYHLMIQEAA